MVSDPLHSSSSPGTWWSTANLNEAIPGVATPLTWTLWYQPTERNIRRVFARIGALSRDETRVPVGVDDRFLAIFAGRAAANLNTFRKVVARIPGMSGARYEEQFFGSTRSDLTDHPDRRRYPIVAVKAPSALWGLERRVQADRRRSEQFWREVVFDDAWRSGSRALLLEAQRRFEHVIFGHGLATSLVQGLYDALTRRCARAGHSGLETTLAGGFGSVEEGHMAAALWEVARARLSLDEFVARYGFHGFDEGELANRVWREAPELLDTTVNSYRELDGELAPAQAMARRERERLAAEAELVGATPRARRGELRLLLRVLRRYTPLREVGKGSFLQMLDVARFAARRLGHELVEQGCIDTPDDVFYLTFDELTDGDLRDGRTDAHERVEARRAARERYRHVELTSLWRGDPPLAAPAEKPEPEGPVVVSGMGVSPGATRGTARVVRDPASLDTLEPGEVLVCHTTDPAWTSLFPVASAVVIDVGGTMSHGAIVARELGVPCVINTRNGTTVLRTGDIVSVDGESGAVEVLERPSSVSARSAQ